VISVTVFIFDKTTTPLKADDFTHLKCVYSIYIAWILNPTFFKQTKKPQA